MTQRNDNRQITTDNQSESMAYRAQAFKEADNMTLFIIHANCSDHALVWMDIVIII